MVNSSIFCAKKKSGATIALWQLKTIGEKNTSILKLALKLLKEQRKQSLILTITEQAILRLSWLVMKR